MHIRLGNRDRSGEEREAASDREREIERDPDLLMGDYFSSRIGITAIIMMCATDCVLAHSLSCGDRTQTVDGGGCREMRRLTNTALSPRARK